MTRRASSTHGRPRCDCFCFIAPPDLLAHLAKEGTPEQRDAALQTIASSASIRARRSIISELLQSSETRAAAFAFMAVPAQAQRTVYDAQHGGQASLPGQKVRGEGDPATGDDSANEAYDGAGATYDFYEQVFSRNSIDGGGMDIVSSVHFGVGYDNAFWNGSQMVYGDGSGHIFATGHLTKSIDVIGHELTHGVTQFTSGLTYHRQSGALNEHFSDVGGILIKQRSLGQTADQADWLIGEGTLVPALGKALRSMKAPGTAFAGDRQPADMDHYQDLPDNNLPGNDNGGVHINSGIPNHAFYLAATAIGGNAWETAGHIWYTTFTEKLDSTADFKTAAEATVEVAGDAYSQDVQDKVRSAWQQVGVL
jgi:Zn-dependent metalloprotease